MKMEKSQSYSFKMKNIANNEDYKFPMFIHLLISNVYKSFTLFSLSCGLSGLYSLLTVVYTINQDFSDMFYPMRKLVYKKCL